MTCPAGIKGCKHAGNDYICGLCPNRGATVKENLTVAAKKPVRANKYKQEIDLIFMSLCIDVVKEYKFHASRRWRWDWAVPDIKVAVEYQGLNFAGGKSSHQTIGGVTGDCEKYSEAAIDGWCLILVTAISVDNGLAHDLILRAVNSRRKVFLQDVGRRNRLTDRGD